MKLGEVLMLNNVLSGLKATTVDKEVMFALLTAKLAISHPAKQVEADRQKTIEELCPDFEQTHQYTPDFVRYFDKYLDGDIDVNLPKIKQDDVCLLAKENGLTIGQAEILLLLV